MSGSAQTTGRKAIGFRFPTSKPEALLDALSFAGMRGGPLEGMGAAPCPHWASGYLCKDCSQRHRLWAGACCEGKATSLEPQQVPSWYACPFAAETVLLRWLWQLRSPSTLRLASCRCYKPLAGCDLPLPPHAPQQAAILFKPLCAGILSSPTSCKTPWGVTATP